MQITAERREGSGGRPRNGRRTLLRLYHYMAEWKMLFPGLIATLLAALVCELAMPLIVESAINAINFTGGISVDFRGLAVSVGLLIAVALISGIMGWAQERISARLTLNVARRLRQDTLRHLLDKSVSSFESKRRGDIMSRITNDVEMAASTFSETAKELFSCLLVVTGCAVIMFLKCPPVAAACIGVSILSVLVSGAVSKMVYPAFRAQQASLGALNAHVEESLKTFRTCKTGGREAENDRRMKRLSADYCACRLRACRLEFMMGQLMLLLGNLNFLVTIGLGAERIIAGAITVGAMQAFILYSMQFMEPLSSLGEYFVRMQNALAGAERVFELMDEKNERAEIAENADASGSGRAGQGIAFQNVSFAYHRNHPVLKGLDLRVDHGERLALVGRTGTGKTTLMNLLLLFYPGFSGSITIDGCDIRAMPPEQLRSRITFVSQEPQIIDGTVYDNIAYGCPEATPESVTEALEKLGIARMVESLPDGLNTRMNGICDSLSQGQLQLICVARAMLRQSEILILDEATSSLDPDTEQQVTQGMEAAMSGRTAIVIAHRISTVHDADHIAVMEDGAIAEYGDHKELMARGGIYRTLYQMQFAGREI